MECKVNMFAGIEFIIEISASKQTKEIKYQMISNLYQNRCCCPNLKVDGHIFQVEMIV